MNEHDTILIQELKESYERQLVWYKDLRDLVQKSHSKLILSRGDVSGLLSGLIKKQKLMECIENERCKTADSVQKWQAIKKQIEICDETNALNNVLEETSNAIKDFLDEEEKLKKYLEGIIKKESLQQ